MTDYIATEIKPFVHVPDEFMTEEERKDATDLKEFSNSEHKLTFMESRADLNTKLNDRYFYVDIHGLRKYYKFSMEASIK